MKVAGTKKYPYGAGSLTDQVALGFDTMGEAEAHAERMNQQLETFETDATWNKDYWKSKPLPWHAFAIVH